MLNRCPKALPDLAQMLEDLGNPTPAAIAKTLGVNERTVRRWISEGRAPRPAALALFWLTSWGFNIVHTEAQNHAAMSGSWVRILAAENVELRKAVGRLLELGEFGAANDPASLDLPGVTPLGLTASMVQGLRMYGLGSVATQLPAVQTGSPSAEDHETPQENQEDRLVDQGNAPLPYRKCRTVEPVKRGAGFKLRCTFTIDHNILRLKAYVKRLRRTRDAVRFARWIRLRRRFGTQGWRALRRG